MNPIPTSTQLQARKDDNISKTMKRAMLGLNAIMLAIGNCGGPLVQRLYFVKGGKRVWLSSCLLTGGWPFMIIPIIASFLYQKRNGRQQTKLFSLNPSLFIHCAVLGVLTGLDDYMAAYGVSRLPVSTSALIMSTQLVFNAGFAFILVKQKLSAFTINSIYLLSIGAVILALHSSTDRPDHESSIKYYEGFFVTLGASALYGFVLPSVELTFKKARQPITYSLVMEMQLVMSFFATAFCTIGMLINHDFKAILQEANEFELSKMTYYVVLAMTALLLAILLLGSNWNHFCASSLLSGIIIASLLPVTESLAVLFFHDKFQVEKESLLLYLFGPLFPTSTGELRHIKKVNHDKELGSLLPQ